MISLNEYSQEISDIRNRILTEAHSAKYYTVKQSIALLKKNIEGLESEEDQAYAIYKALGDPERLGGYSVLTGEGSKIIVKDYYFDNYSSAKSSESAYKKHGEKYQQAFDAIMKDSTIEELYNKGKEIFKRKQKEEAEAKKEAERLCKNKAYKEFCDEFKGAHLLFKAWALYNAFTQNNLWTTIENSLYTILIKGLNGCKHIKASEAEPGKFYLIATEDGPNLQHKKDDHPSGRWNIINILSVVKCVGDDKWNVIMSRSHYAYAEPDINRTKIESFFDNDPSLVELDEYLEKNTSKIEDGIKRYIKLIQDDIEYDKKTGGREIFRYSTLAKALIEKDEIA